MGQNDLFKDEKKRMRADNSDIGKHKNLKSDKEKEESRAIAQNSESGLDQSMRNNEPQHPAKKPAFNKGLFKLGMFVVIAAISFIVSGTDQGSTTYKEFNEGEFTFTAFDDWVIDDVNEEGGSFIIYSSDDNYALKLQAVGDLGMDYTQLCQLLYDANENEVTSSIEDKNMIPGIKSVGYSYESHDEDGDIYFESMCIDDGYSPKLVVMVFDDSVKNKRDVVYDIVKSIELNK